MIVSSKQKYNLIAIVALLILIFFLRLKIDRLPEKEEITQSSPMETLPSVEYISAYTGSIVLGGFKPLVIDYLWITADKLNQHHQYDELKSILNLTARLQPKVVDVWTFNAHAMAYNISLRLKSEAHQWEWVNAGLEHLYDGLRWNPDNKDIMSSIGMIYYHRFPQDRIIMEKLEKLTGKSCYIIASEWFQKIVETLTARGDSKYEIEKWAMMDAACRFNNIFERLRKVEFNLAIKETGELSGLYAEIFRKYGIDGEMLAEKAKGCDLLKAAFILEKELWKYNPETTPDEFFSRLPDVLREYDKVLANAKYTDNVPIRARMEQLFSPYLAEIFKGIYAGRFDAAKEWLKKMIALEEEVIPDDPAHSSAFFFNAFKERLVKLEEIIRAEEALAATPHNNEKAYIPLLRKTIELYVIYFSQYNYMFNLAIEFERMNRLQSVWQKGE
ncbi:MAG: hypothetical protein HY811_01435 [Planctomycetes bacterium]|nr:hypothetical protein [Planctomycetota bacterium]